MCVNAGRSTRIAASFLITIHGYQNSLEEKDQQEKMLAFATNKIPQRFQLGKTTKVQSAPPSTFGNIDDADEELYFAFQFALKGHCADILARVSRRPRI